MSAVPIEFIIRCPKRSSGGEGNAPDLRELRKMVSRRTVYLSNFSLLQDGFEAYIPALNWLAELDAFSGGTREID